MPAPDNKMLSIQSDSTKRLPLRKRFVKDPPTLKWQPVELAPPTQLPSTYPDYLPRKIEIIPMTKSHIEYPPTPSSSHESPHLGISAKHAESSDCDSTETDDERMGHEPSPPAMLAGKSPKEEQEWNAGDLSDSLRHATSRKASWLEDDALPTKKIKKTIPAPPQSFVKESSPTPSQQSNLRPSTTFKAPRGRSSSDNSTLYCICRMPYDVPRFMIACDRCDQWFHGECIGISEKQGEFIDLYFCTDCAKATGKSTTWKPKCANSKCQKAARVGTHQGHLSKYCTKNCGMQAARDSLEFADPKRQISGQLAHEKPKKDDKTTSISKSRPCSFADRDDRQRLLRVRSEKMQAKTIIGLVEQKMTFLNALLKRSHTGSDADRCGFDTRLSWSDDTWSHVRDVQVSADDISLVFESGKEKAFSACQQQRGCTKHLDWKKIKASEFQLERKEQFTILSMLDQERKQIKARMQRRREELDVAKALANGTICHVYDIVDK